MDVSIIIVNYNTKQLTLDCLKTVYEQTKNITFEVFVSDNGSTDGSVLAIKEDFPLVHIIENNENLGFGAANNRAFYKATGKYVFYLNSDTLLLNNAVKYFFDYWENTENREEIGALGCRLLDKEGNFIHSGASFPTPKGALKTIIVSFISCYIYRWIPHKTKKRPEQYKLGKIDYVTGADLFMLNNEDARFDESYFMYCEEVDMQKKLFDKGKFSFLIDGPRVVHLEGASSGKKEVIGRRFNTFSEINMWISNFKFLRKFYGSSVLLNILPHLVEFIWFFPDNIKVTKAYRKNHALYD